VTSVPVARRTGGPAVGGHVVKGARISMRGASIELGGNPIVRKVDLDIGEGEFVCLLGPSGCGKSTLLNAIAGFQPLASGSIAVDGQTISGPSIERGIVFQSSEALFPWLTVRQNVEYGPRMRGGSQAKCREQSDHYLALVGLAHVADRLPAQLSGGMRQRVQIARVLANEPSTVLMDEPFGALDAQTRLIMQSEISRIWRATRPTVIFVTHDIGEALLLADRVVTMSAGPAAGLKRVVAVDVEHPRDLADPRMVRLFRELREDIGAEVTKALRAQGLEPATA
jgi:NitT/TauT family transport system ATP-binding protein